MIQEHVARERRGRQDIPFGVRAIESGVEVEGVWISRNTTPASSAPGSPMLSPQMKGKATSRTSEVPSLDPSHPYGDNRSSRSPASSTGSFERAVSAERLDSVSTSDLAPSARQAYQPRQPSQLRFSTADNMDHAAGQHPGRSGSGSSQGSSEGLVRLGS